MTVTYSCVFNIIIQATNGAFDLTRKLDLPFVPQVGMSIHGVFCDGGEMRIESLTYDLQDREFWVCSEENAGDCWDRDFTMDDARSFMERGVLVDNRSDPEAWWAEHVAWLRRHGRPDDAQ